MAEREKDIGEQLPEIFQGIKEYFIRESTYSGLDKERLLGKMWEVLNALFPTGNTAEVTLRIPSDRLVELGLVSETKAGEITGRKIRKKHKTQSDEPLNIIRFHREMGDGEGVNTFVIVKTYVSEEQERPFRIDKIVAEEIRLERDKSGRYNFSVRKRDDNIHLHTLGQRWVQANPSEASELQEVEPDIRDINRALALIAEGLKPGCLGDRLF